MMEDDWFLPYIGGQPLQKFFIYHKEEAKKCVQQPSNGPQKTVSTPQIFQKKYKELFTFVSASAVARVSEAPPEISRGAPHTLLAYYYELQ